MLSGRVSLDLQAWVSVEILDADDQPRSVEVVLDTGFEGELALSARTIRLLGLAEAGYQWVELANGARDRWPRYAGTVLWEGRRLVVDVIESGSDPLLGMALLEGCRVTVEVRDGGAVVVDVLA